MQGWRMTYLSVQEFGSQGHTFEMQAFFTFFLPSKVLA